MPDRGWAWYTIEAVSNCLILFLERKSIKKNFNLETKTIAIPGFLPGDDIVLLIEESYQEWPQRPWRRPKAARNPKQKTRRSVSFVLVKQTLWMPLPDAHAAKRAAGKFPVEICRLHWRRHPDLNRGIRVLQTLALPLGYVAI